MTKKRKLKDLILNEKKDNDKPIFSEKLKKVVFNITSNFNLLEERINKLEMVDIDPLADKLKPVDAKVEDVHPKFIDVKVKDAKTPKDVSKALHTKISSKQKTNLRRGDSVADILARIFQSMNESRIAMIKRSELERNYKDEHIKEKERKIIKKKFTYKKHKARGDKSDFGPIIMMGLLANFGDIVKWVESLVEPFTTFINDLKTGYDNFDIGEKTKELAETITSFLDDMKHTLLENIDNFLNKWIDELVGWIETKLGFKFDGENIPRSNLSGSGYRTPEGDQKTAEMVQDKESGMPPEEFNKKYNVDTTAQKSNTGKMSSATVTQTAEDKAEEKRSMWDRMENAVNNVGSAAYKVGAGVASTIGHVTSTIFDNVTDDVGSMVKQTGKDLSARSKQTYKNITAVEKTPEETKQYEKQQSEYKKTHKPGMFGPVEIPKSEQKIIPTNPIVDKINTSEVTSLTTPSVEYNKNQSKNNDLTRKTKSKPSISSSTPPPKTVDLSSKSNNSGNGNSAEVRSPEPTLNRINSGIVHPV